jgi:uncharacterized protein YoxC
MDQHDRHVAVDYARLLLGVSALIAAICFAILVGWLVLSKQDSKLYEADNTVCVSQPLQVQCFERKPR